MVDTYGLEMNLRKYPETGPLFRGIFQEQLIGTLGMYVARRQAEEESLIDYKTGLPNGKYAKMYLKRALADAQRTRGPLSIIYGDMNGLKRVNDTRGHDAGDEIIKYLAIIILDSLRESDEAMRFGSESDEFLVGLPNTTAQYAELVATRIAHSVDRQFDHNPSIALGIATYNPKLHHPKSRSAIEPTDFVKAAERAMYEAKKQNGHSAVVVSDANI